MTHPVLVWVRSDFRLLDNPALSSAAASGRPVVVVYVHDKESNGRWFEGAASRWWLHHSLIAFDESLRKVGNRLVVVAGNYAQSLARIAEVTGAHSLYFNKRYEPAARLAEAEVDTVMKSLSVDCQSFNGCLLFEPDAILNGQGLPYLVFTPFWNSLKKRPVRELKSPISQLQCLDNSLQPASLEVGQLGLLPKIKWDSGLKSAWVPGEAGAMEQLGKFIKNGLADYSVGRDRPDYDGVSRLSPYLHFGEISPQTIWHAVSRQVASDSRIESNGECYLRELGWREFAHNLLFHFPDTTEEPLKKPWVFPWSTDAHQLSLWQSGQTGYPIVDAGMRQLWNTGWMHNRVRMIVASFLIKDLMIPWQSGAEWFWDTLVDADLASNTLGWQWTAGCGADAAPYFRIFNPTSQGEKFDPSGEYVRKWVPELSRMPVKFIHRPWEASPEVLENAGVTLGHNYPLPVVDHSEARKRALSAFQEMKALPRM